MVPPWHNGNVYGTHAAGTDDTEVDVAATEEDTTEVEVVAPVDDSGTEHCHAVVQPVALVIGLHVPGHGVAGCAAIGQSGCWFETADEFVVPLHEAAIAARV